MELTPEQRTKLLEVAKERWGFPNRKCDICRSQAWTIHTKIYETREFFGAAIRPGSILPFVVVECNNCANTLFFNAIKSGVVSATGGSLEG